MPAMKSSPNSLDPDQIAAHCSALARVARLEVIQHTGSTNTDLLGRLPTLTQPVLLVAETQSAGRGRAGRSWLSEPGASLTFSLAWPFAQSPQGLLGLPLAVGVALAQTLISLNVPVQLKWPNDVLKQGKKLAGILVETASSQQHTWAVIGIGLNLVMPGELEAQIGHSVADATWLAQMDRNQLLAALLNQLVVALQRFEHGGFVGFVDQWNALHAYAGQRVNLVDQGRTIQQGVALGVNSQGCLMLQDDSGVIQPVMVGDVSLRINQG